MPNDEVAQAALDRAVEETDQLLLVYQPIHDVRDGSVYAAEALLRQRRENGEIREAQIITDAAEDSCGPELFLLDAVLVRKAYTDAAQWPKDLRLNINLSPREFQEGRVRERLHSLVTACGIDTRRINLEITETSYIEKPEETVHILDELRELGLELWLDDFGTGHSSITHLQHFPLDGLKLPGAFVRDLVEDPRCRAIVRSLITMAHDLDMRVIAEEVETREQLDIIVDLGCEYIQGFYFSKPMEPDDFMAFLQRLP
jgi:EAL domain-containing protein (putative c-di-GMP-specific phosphodiesterase class I)